VDFAIAPGVRDPERERALRLDHKGDYVAGPLLVSRLPAGLVDTRAWVICPSEHQYLRDSVRGAGNLPRIGGYVVEPDLTLELEVADIPVRDERVVPLGAQANLNYSHWMFESVLRALLFLTFDDGGYCYLTPKLRPWQRAMLERVGVPPERIVEHEPAGLVRFSEVIAVSRGFTRQHMLIPAAVQAIAGLVEPRPRRGGRRIYCSRERDGHRKATNAPELWDLLRRRGFEELHPAKVPFAEQIELFAEAEAVVGVHGSGLTNIVFAPPGIATVELMLEGFDLGATVFIRTLAELCGQSHLQVVCPVAAGTEHLPLMRQDITIDLGQLDELLEGWLGG
jgi:capsular polysaccharide biosynthesis protein